MDRTDWRGVFAAITTPLRADFTVDHDALARHVAWLVESGCRGIVPNGSLGESATLAFSEKVEILRTCCRAATFDGSPPSAKCSAIGSPYLPGWTT
jgi:dihydrodipicolinate synthase/N-acetylneuraminate lyase